MYTFYTHVCIHTYVYIVYTYMCVFFLTKYTHMCVYIHVCRMDTYIHTEYMHHVVVCTMGWLQLVGSIKFYVSFAKETYKRDAILSVQRHRDNICIMRKSVLIFGPIPLSYRYL